MDFEIDESRLLELLRCREFLLLRNHLGKKPVSRFSDLEKKAWVHVQAGLLNSHEAQVYYQKFRLQDPTLEAWILFYCADYEQALEKAKIGSDPYLVPEILLALNRYRDALEAIRGLEVDGQWHYFAGRIYGHLQDFPKSILCLEKAARWFRIEKDRISELDVLANLGNYLNQSGQFKKAEAVFKKVQKELKNPHWKYFSSFRARTLINIGRFDQDHGNLGSALRNLFKARKLLRGSPGAPDEIRVQLLLAYLFKDLGHYRKSIALLESIDPRKQFQKLDRLRYLSNCYLELGELDRAEKAIKEAREHLADEDWFGKAYLLTDELEILIRQQRESEAKTLYQSILDSSDKKDDPVTAHYAKSRWAWRRKDPKTAQISLKFHLQKKLLTEASFDRLTLSYDHLRRNKASALLAELSRLPETTSPVFEAWRLLFEVAVEFKAGRKVPRLKWERGMRIASGRDLFLLRSLFLFLKIQFKPEQIDLNAYQEASLKLMESDREDFQEFVSFLPQNKKKLLVVIQSRSFMADWVEILSYHLSEEYSVLDLSEKKLMVRGSEKLTPTKNPTQWRLLEVLASNAEKWLEKSELAEKVFGRREYHPLRDDNKIYVTFSRLKKIFPKGSAPFKTEEGKYRFTPTPGLVLISDPTCKSK